MPILCIGIKNLPVTQNKGYEKDGNFVHFAQKTFSKNKGYEKDGNFVYWHSKPYPKTEDMKDMEILRIGIENLTQKQSI